MRSTPLLCDSDDAIPEVTVPRGRIGARSLRPWLVFALAALVVGCSADAIHSPQKFFPGSRRTAWNQCSKFTEIANEVVICADLGVMPGDTFRSYIIDFFIPAPEHVRIAVFDENAKLVRILFDADEPATLSGTFRTPPIPWDFTDGAGNRVPEGDYRIYFQAGDFVSTSDVAVE